MIANVSHLIVTRYGSRTVELLRRYYQGELSGIGTEDAEGGDGPTPQAEASANGSAHQERLESNGNAAAGRSPNLARFYLIPFHVSKRETPA